MSLERADYEAGLRYYQSDLARRSSEIQRREKEFDELETNYIGRTPPHFTREDLLLILKWKYTDARRCARALRGLTNVDDAEIRQRTENIAPLDHPAEAAEALNGFVPGVGIAGVSAILAAANPHRFPVNDVFALLPLCQRESLRWVQRLSMNDDGRHEPTAAAYLPYTTFCREAAANLEQSTRESWTPRRVDMALWGLGKQLDREHRTDPACRVRRPDETP